MALKPEEVERYRRQLDLPGWGEKGQEKLKNSTVFVAGAGGLGSPVLLYLAFAGVGTIRLCDDGRVERSNLNRQILYGEGDIGRLKTEAAANRLRAANPDAEVIPLNRRIDDGNVEKTAGDSDLIVDCLDNFETRYVINRHCVRKGAPFVHAGVAGFSGQMLFVHPPETACLACVFPEMPESGIVPIAGATAGVVGSLEAVEAIRFLLGEEPVGKNRLLIWSGGDMVFDVIEVEKAENCPVCGSG
jgi:molybdopterin-synthase adenylyltransferase